MLGGVGRILGVDWGEKRMGIAASDELHLTASGRSVIPADGALDEIAKLAADEHAERVVVGMPVHDDGRPSKSAPKIGAFVEALRAKLAVPVETWDESNASWEANEILKARGKSWKESKKEIDRVAAAVMLQSWLDAHGKERA